MARLAIVFLALGLSLQAAPEHDACDLGRRVIAVRQALQQPANPKSLGIIADLGTDSRYYAMVRGWLSLELQAAESLERAGHDETLRVKHGKKAAFLRQAIRQIDLE